MFSLEKSLTKDSNILKVKVKNYGECGYSLDPENKVILNIPWAVWSQWLYISQQIGNKEWGGVFSVKGDIVTNFKIPKQEVTSTDCEFKEELGGDGIVHSHHDMGAFHSSQDDSHARNLFTYSIVISNKECEATKRLKLPCGAFGYVKVGLTLIECPDLDLSKITEKKQELLPERYHENQQRELDLGLDEFPCYRCESFKCKTCNVAMRGKDGELLPFCEFCEDYDSCNLCPKLAMYLDNYPEDREHFEYLYANKL